jgi:hypothetical protein
MILAMVHLQVGSAATIPASPAVATDDLLPADSPSFIQQLLLVLFGE